MVARHFSIELTMKYYAYVVHKSEVSAIESLKNLTQTCQSGKQTRTSIEGETLIMPKKQQCQPDNKDTEKMQCHFISNTHWDREWRYSMQRTRHMLVYMMDMLLDILENYPEFSSFHLDSQTVPIQDYIEIRPEK